MPDDLRTLIDEDTLLRRVDELAAQISSDYADTSDLMLVGVLKGAFIFLSDLSRRLTIEREIAQEPERQKTEIGGALDLLRTEKANLGAT